MISINMKEGEEKLTTILNISLFIIHKTTLIQELGTCG
jgi:hypothetical protein